LSEFGTAAILRNANFRDLDKVLEELGIEKVSGILFDLGVSLTQLQDPSRGFGIKVDSPLDMRMDRRLRTSAFDVVNRLGEHKLVGVLQQFGEERFARRIARAICEERVAHPISTTKELAHIVMRNIPYKYRRGPIHPATKTFQAIRIYVNDELGALEEGLKKAIGYLEGGARACVISFHSLEDALVKNILREFSRQNIVKIITKKPLTPKAGEIASNPRCRSAKLRTAERIKDL
jgi:16S rRNA (cytosine1402-N4)-methyltransferase